MSDAIRETGQVALTFGSALRAGRDDPAYQSDRLLRLTGFALRLLDAYRKRLQIEQKHGREIWDGKEWLAQQRDAWEREAAQAQQTVHELRVRTEELEQAKAWLAEQLERQRAAEAALRAQLEAQEVRLNGQQAQLEALRARVDACRRRPAYRLLVRLGLLSPLDAD